MAVTVKNNKGQKVVLLNPQEKRDKYFNELQNDVHLTNEGMIKTGRTGKPRELSDTAKAYRAGYIQAQNDSASCYKARKSKKVTRKKTK